MNGFLILATSYCLSLGTFVATPGERVTVPLSLNTAENLSYASARVAYDPEVLSFDGAQAETLDALLNEDFTCSATNGQVSVSLYGSTTNNLTGGAGSLARLTFTVRSGTVGCYSDLTVSEAELGDCSGLLDVTADGSLSVKGGAIRVVAENAIPEAARAFLQGGTSASSSDEERQALLCSAKQIAVEGSSNVVEAVSNLGLSPRFPSMLDESGTLRLTYSLPTMDIIAFDASTGEVRLRITPGAGNEIVSKPATGYMQVYGTDELGTPMTLVDSVKVDLTPYLDADTLGEVAIKVTKDSRRFLQVKTK